MPAPRKYPSELREGAQRLVAGGDGGGSGAVVEPGGAADRPEDRRGAGHVARLDQAAWRQGSLRRRPHDARGRDLRQGTGQGLFVVGQQHGHSPPLMSHKCAKRQQEFQYLVDDPTLLTTSTVRVLAQFNDTVTGYDPSIADVCSPGAQSALPMQSSGRAACQAGATDRRPIRADAAQEHGFREVNQPRIVG